MDTPQPPHRPRAWQFLRGATLDITPMRESRDFSILFGSQFVNQVGSQIRMVTIPYLVFIITGHSSLAVGLISLAQFVPAALTSTIGGTLSDVMDRRTLLIYTQILLAITSAMLTAAAFIGTPKLWFIFLVVAIASGIGAIDQPTRRAAIPSLISRNQIANALAVQQALQELTIVVGPSLAGVVLAAWGAGPALLIDTVTFLIALVGLFFIAPLPPKIFGAPKRGFAAVREGFSYLKSEPVILSTFAIDINAMFFGGPRALFPALALDVFKVGQTGLGLLYAAPGVGALLGSLMTGWVGKVRHQGVAVLISICVWGAAIAAFGLFTRFFWLSLVLIAIAYAADAFSALFRGTILQLAVPDRLRGRLTAMHYLVVTSGPQLGNVESGAVAQAFDPQISVWSGGIAAAIGAILTVIAIPQLLRYDASKPVVDTEEYEEASPIV